MIKRAALVSVYIPTRNRKGLLPRAIRSVLEQDYSPIQIIIVDDASDEDTESIVGGLVSAVPGGKSLEYTRLERPSGAGAARNRAIELVRGELVTGLDDDDYFLPGRISRLVAAFEPARCAFVFDGYVRETTRSNGSPRRTTIPLGRPADLRGLLKRNIVGNQVLTLTARFRDVGGFDEHLPAWEDHDLWIRLVRNFGAGSPAGGVSYVHTTGGSRNRISTDTDRACRAFDKFAEKHPEYVDEELMLCLRLAKLCAGDNSLTVRDVAALLRLGEPRYVAFALHTYLTNYWLPRIFR